MKLFLLDDGRARPLWRIVLFVFPFVVILIASGYFVELALWEELLRGSFSLSMIIGGLMGSVAAVLAAWVLLRFVDKRSFRSFGFWFFPNWWRELGWGLLFGAGLNSLVVAALFAGGWVRFSVADFDWRVALIVVGGYFVAFLFPAAAEELVFRGYIFQRLVESWGPAPPVLVTSFLFGWAHFGNPSATWLSTVNTGLAGALMAVMYLRTRALWFPIGFHISWNYVMAAWYSLPVSGLTLDYRLFEVEMTGPEWLSGGGFGPEGSVLATVAFLAATLWLARTRLLEVAPEQREALGWHPIEGSER